METNEVIVENYERKNVSSVKIAVFIVDRRRGYLSRGHCEV